MIGINKQQLIENLKRLQRKRCTSYSIEDEICDCTFGIDINHYIDSQKTGCLELKQAIQLLEGIEDDEYLKLCRLKGIEL